MRIRNSEVTILAMTRNQSSSPAQPAHRFLVHIAAALLVAGTPFATAQASFSTQPALHVIAANTVLDLPDSPGAFLSTSSTSANDTSNFETSNFEDPDGASFDQTQTPPPPKHSGHLQMTVSPNQIASPMTVRDKVVGGFKDSFSLFSATGWLAAAGWEQLTNGSPNFGTDSGAFGQRLGAAALRSGSEGVFSESLFAPLFHEDPRYYIMGSGHSFFKRLVYSGTRVLVTRTDSGRSTPNFALLAGNAAGSALTIPYYPAKNTTFSEVAQTFGGSLGGSAIGFVVDEFILDVLVDLHIKKQQP
jgi:hypothetical protein